MTTFAAENAKLYRKAPEVVVGVWGEDKPVEAVYVVTGSQLIVVPHLADTIPKSTYTSLESQCVFRVGGWQDNYPQQATVYGRVYQSGDGAWKKAVYTQGDGRFSNWSISVSGRDFGGTPIDAFEVMWIAPGDAWYFSSDNLISCNLQLRGIETKADNPALQISEIEVQGYIGDEDEASFASIPENMPVTYCCGYPEDYSPIRKFYLTDVVQCENGVATFRGQDATKFLDSYEYEGTSVKTFPTSGLGNRKGALRSILNGADINYAETDNWVAQSGSTSAYYMQDAGNGREIIADLCNRLTMRSNGENEFLFSCDYVDAGIPTLKMLGAHSKTSALTIPTDQIGPIESQYDRALVRLKMPWIYPTWASNTTLKTRTCVVNKTYRYKTNTPTRNWAITGGTILSSGLYFVRYTATATSVTIKGTEIDLGNDGTVTASVTGTGRTATLSMPWTSDTGFRATSSGDEFTIELMLESKLEYLSPVLYSFTYRGNPRLQPRDVITVGTEVMTIESLTLEHEGGGFQSKIVARKGYV